MKKIGLIVNPAKDPQFAYTQKVVKLLEDAGLCVISLKTDLSPCGITALSEDAFYLQADALVTLGGDGTILEIAAKAAEYQKPVLGVNLGHMGYLSQLEKDDIYKLPEILKGPDLFENRMMLKLLVEFKDGTSADYFALNEVTVSRQLVSNMLHARLFSNSEFVYEFRSDGLIFATPTGSTAYSMSSGGPIADCSLKDIIIVTPVCEHSFFSKSMIFSADDVLSCDVCRHKENTFIVVDGKPLFNCVNIHKIEIKSAESALLLYQTDNKRFYRVLNSKFSDGGLNEKFTSESDS